MSGVVRVVVVHDRAVVDELETAAVDHPVSFSFVHAPSATAAFDALSGGERTAIVTRYVLEEGDCTDGVELVERAVAAGAAPAVVYTDCGSEAVASRATLAGASAYVPSGFANGAMDVLDALAGSSDAAADRTREKIETLHDVATDLEACETEREVFDRTIEAAEQVLEFDQCLVDVRRGDELIPVAKSSGLPEGGAQAVHIDAENVAARVARTQEATINNDLSEVTDADPAEMTYRSGFTVPVSDIAVFQAVAAEVDAFTEDDLELAQLLVAHVAASLKRVRNRRTVLAERDRFAALFENVPDPAVRVTFGADGDEPVVDRVNGAFASTFGCDHETAVGTPLPDVVAPADDEADTDVLGTAHDSVEEVAREVRRETVDGVHDFVLHVIPVDDDGHQSDHDDEGDAVREAYGIYTDITTTKERERALERQNERLDEFASVVSHDLRNPLNVAEGHLVNYQQTGDEASLTEVSDAHERMRELIDDLLELARSGDVVSETTVVDLSEAARRAWASLHTPGAELAIESTSPIHADTARIVDVFANLFRNSVEHGSTKSPTQSDDSAEDGADAGVTIRVGVLEDESGFFVADDGPGIPESEWEAVFETGYTNADDGSGFGLAIVEQVVAAHGWSVSVTNAMDGGARFEFTDVETAD